MSATYELLHADAKDATDFIGKPVQCIVTSPPYYKQRDYGFKEQIGQEHNVGSYVANLGAVMRGLYEVLADDGVFWLNIADTYVKGRLWGIPWQVAQSSMCWTVRADVIWSKPNPKPTNATRHPAMSHEYLFMLTKDDEYGKYYYNADAILEPYAPSTLKQLNTTYTGIGKKQYAGTGAENPSDVKRRIIAGMIARGGSNKKSVWTIPPQPFSGAHFAVMPEALIEPCILSSTRPGDTVLDPFCGTGTVGVVALRHGRNFVGIDADSHNVLLADQRIADSLKGAA